MLERVWRKGNPLTLLVGMQTSTATMENSVEIPLKTGNRTAISSVQFSSVTQSCLTLCGPMDRSTQGLPVHHQLPEFTQTHVHQVGLPLHKKYDELTDILKSSTVVIAN